MYPTFKDHKVWPLKFNFLFVVLQMIKNDKVTKWCLKPSYTSKK